MNKKKLVLERVTVLDLDRQATAAVGASDPYFGCVTGCTYYTDCASVFTCGACGSLGCPP